VVLTPSGEQISIDKCSREILQSAMAPATQEPQSSLHVLLPDQVKSLEIKLIRKALQETHGNKTRAAELLGITRQGLHKKIQRYAL
jgi:DNA-binding NtrC family response regulator